MRRERLTITLDPTMLSKIDALIDGKDIRNRSHAIESVLKKSMTTSISQAIILTGGSGSDSNPLTNDIPASLIPFRGKPIIEYQIELIKNAGITEIIICTGHLGSKIVEKYGDGNDLGVKIKYKKEAVPLGTAGSIKSVRELISKSPFLVLYGDVLTDIDMGKFTSFHESKKYIATIALTTNPNPQSYGMVEVNGIDIVGFTEKPTDKYNSSYIVNTGMYIMESEILDYIEENKKVSLEVDIFPKLAKDRLLAAYNTSCQWYDLSHPETYEEAEKKFK